MTHDIYRAAYQEAASEHSQILAREEQLRLRQQLIETAIQALEPLSATQDAAAAAIQPPVSIPAEFLREQPVAEPIPFQIEEFAAKIDTPQGPFAPEPTSDPVASRINNALWDWNHSAAQLQPAS